MNTKARLSFGAFAGFLLSTAPGFATLPTPTANDDDAYPYYSVDITQASGGLISESTSELAWWGRAGRIYFGVDYTTNLLGEWQYASTDDIVRGIDAPSASGQTVTFDPEMALPSQVFFRLSYFDPAGVSIHSRDFDGDGIDDLDEYSNYLVHVNGNNDNDNNQLPDDWEEFYFHEYFPGDRNSSPSADPDHDGLTNLQEYQARTDPLSPIIYGTQRFTLYSFAPQANGTIEVIYWGDSFGGLYATYADPGQTGILKRQNLTSLRCYPRVDVSTVSNPPASECQAIYQSIITDNGDRGLQFTVPPESTVAYDVLRRVDGVPYGRHVANINGVPTEVRLPRSPQATDSSTIVYDGQSFLESSETTLDGNLVVTMQGDSGGYMWATYAGTGAPLAKNLTHIQVAPVVPEDWTPDPDNLSYRKADISRITGDDGNTYLRASDEPGLGAVQPVDLLRAILGISYSSSLKKASGEFAWVSEPADLVITSQPVTEVKLFDANNPQNTEFPSIIRDFSGLNVARQPDFESGLAFSPELGMVTTSLGSDGLPQFAYDDPGTHGTFYNWETFQTWYRSHDVVNLSVKDVGTCVDPSGVNCPYGIYSVDDQFLPLADRMEATTGVYLFTAEIHAKLDYDKSTTRLYVKSDDDCWVFINGQLAVDIGGAHPHREVNDTIAHLAPGLIDSTGTCDLAVFYAERYIPDAFLAVRSNSVMRPTYAYQVVAESLSDRPAVFSLAQAPSGMTIDSISGKVLWDYSNASPGSYPVTVLVSDGHGGADSQSFVVNVSQ